jgi:MoxR-like ATPase
VPNTSNSGRRPAQTSFASYARQLMDNMARVIKGKEDVMRLVLTCLFAEGHVLIEDVPGVGKTSIARALAASIGGTWRRIQFTPDLLPSDVTGVTIFNQQSKEFHFRPGGVFANLVVADEINRASPKTQSALLEVMEERFVTVDSERHPVPRPFVVVATQNPIEMDGTYRLPEAQLDRFLMRISVGYPDASAEMAILRQDHGLSPDNLEPVLPAETVAALVAHCQMAIHVDDAVHDYIIRVSAGTRRVDSVRLGVSPRGSVAMLRAAKALAAISDRDYVLPEDVQALAVPVLSHRILIKPEDEMRGVTTADVVERVVAETEVPLRTA